LTSEGALVNNVNSEGSCALRTAARLGHTKVVSLLLQEYDAQVDSRNTHNSETALHFACKNNHEDVIKVLVQFRADLSLTNNNGALASGILKKRNPQLAKWLEHERCSPSKDQCTSSEKRAEYVTAASQGDVDAVRRLISEGMDVDAENNEGESAFRRAARFGHATVVRLLLAEFGANVNAPNRHDQGTALHYACKFNHEGVIRTLVEFRADGALKNKGGNLASAYLEKRNIELARWVQAHTVPKKHLRRAKSRQTMRNF
jgi:ankyrin repeat protein